MKKRFLSILTALALVLTLLPGTALAEGTTEGALEQCPFTVKNGNDDATEGTHYIWEAEATDGGGNTNTVNMLTIKTSGLTVANTNPETNASAVIVVENNVTTLTLDGVHITAPGSSGALNTSGQLTINLADGSNNTLTGGSDGGHGIDAGTLTINGPGTLQAQGTSGKHGIQIKQSVTITGGTVTATGGDSNGAGIKFEGEASDRKVIISGGNVTAKGGVNGMGISAGGGSGGSTTTFSTGTDGTAIIHVSSFGDGITKASQLSGIIFEGRTNATGYDGVVYGNQILEKDFTVNGGEVLTIPEGTKLTLNNNMTLTNSGAIHNNGIIDVTNGNLAGEQVGGTGKIIKNGAMVFGPFLVTGGTGTTAPCEWMGPEKTLTINTSEALTISMAEGVTTPVPACITAKNTSTVENTFTYGPINLTLDGVHITTQDGDSALGSDTLNTAALRGGEVNLTLNGNNTLTGGDTTSKNSFGIYAKGALNISGTGTLKAAGGTVSNGMDSAGICSKASITITGGEVTAIGGSSSYNSFGIYAVNSNAGENPTITISGGNVTATGGSASADSYGIFADGEIKIEGGTGTAKTNKTNVTNKGAMNKQPTFGDSVAHSGTSSDTELKWFPAVTSVTVNPNTLNLTTGQTSNLSVAVAPDSAHDKTVTWSSNNTSVATVDANTGVVTAVSEGTATITATANDSQKKTGTCTVTVSAAPVTQYTVTFNSNGGSAVANQTITSGGKVTKPTDPTKAGNAFGGWYEEAGCTNAWDFANDTVTANITLYAKWTAETPTTYTVTFNGNGGTPATQTAQTKADGKLTNLPTATRSNHTFLGWFTAASGGDKVTLDKVYTANTTVYAHWSYNGSSGGDWGGGSSGGSSSGDKETVKNPDGSTTTTEEKKDGTVIEETKHPDGTEVTVETKPDGSVTEETKRPDGSTTTVEKQPDGTVITTDKDKEGNTTEVVAKPDGSSVTTVEKVDGTVTITVVDPSGKVLAEVKLTDKALEGKEVVEIPMPALPSSTDRETAPTVTLGVPDGVTVKVEIPVEAPRPGTVAILVNEDGSEEIVRTSVATEDGVALTVEGVTTVKIVDNSKDFVDVPAQNWAADAVDFVSARELFNGTSATTFAPDLPMSRAMLAKVLHNLESNPDAGLNGIFPDVDNGAWYAEAVSWAADKGIVSGYPDGSFGANDSISREQLAVMLWRYAGSPEPHGSLGAFPDGNDASGYAITALRWAVGEGIIGGTDQGTLMPGTQATRAQVAAMMMRFCQNVK